MTQGSGRGCIFCARRGVRFSHEHIISDWIAKQIHGGRPDSFRYDAIHKWESNYADIQEWAYQMKLIQVKTKGVCEDCNTGWMSRTEKAAQPIIAPLIQGKPLHLTLPQQAALASWATLKMMVLDYAMTASKRPYGRFFTTEELTRFYDDSARRPPESILLFAARHQGVNEGWMGVADFIWDHSSGKKVRASTLVLVVGQLAFVMLGHRITADIVGPHLVGFDVSHLKKTAYPLHPAHREFSWPPASSLNDEGLGDALHRWRLNPPQTRRRSEPLP